jgi:nucleotide-binding universal stress UspA family protein
MYKHILLPTDGSEASKSAIVGGIKLAGAVGARVTGLHVAAKPAGTPLDRWVRGETDVRARLRDVFAEQGKRYLAFIEEAASEAGVPCESICVSGNAPYEKILQAAREQDCDLIYMASHGMGGATELLLGSETAKVLTHSPIPVLVHREPRAARRARDGKAASGSAAESEDAATSA